MRTHSPFSFDFLLRIIYNVDMTIHHDKLAYGKLASNMEELSEEEILKMLEQLQEEEENGEESAKNKTDKSQKL